MSNAEHTTSIASPVPTPAHPSQGAGSTNDTSTTGPATRRGHIGRIVAGSLATGVVAALLLVAAPFIQEQENDITGAVLWGFALGWAMLAVLSVRFTDQPHRWAVAPAVFMGVSGLLLVAFGSGSTMPCTGYGLPRCWR
jgi:peptidoglycan/LPS O-acetylase OafA/YrhL